MPGSTPASATAERVVLARSGARFERWRETWRLFRRNRVALVGLGLLVLLFALALGAPVLTAYDPTRQSLAEALRPMSRAHPLGTDQLGRDMLARLLYGSRLSLVIGFLAVGVGLVLGVPLGVISAVRQDSALDYVLRVFSLAGLSMPSFWLGMVIILGLVAWLGWIPPVTYVSPRENLGLHLIQFTLPALAVGYRSSALITRITRSSLLEVMREDYIRTARAKGQSGGVVIWRHALKNAVLPVVTVIGIEFAFLIGGLVVTETVFNLPGVARFLVEAILWRDYPVVQNLVMFIAVVVILSNLAVDMLYGVLDPRVRYGH